MRLTPMMRLRNASSVLRMCMGEPDAPIIRELLGQVMDVELGNAHAEGCKPLDNAFADAAGTARHDCELVRPVLASSCAEAPRVVCGRVENLVYAADDAEGEESPEESCRGRERNV